MKIDGKWLAGYFEQRGSIFIHKKSGKTTRSRAKYFLRLTIADQPRVLAEILKIFPGNQARIRANIRARDRFKNSVYIEYTGRHAKPVLLAIKPHSITRLPEIEVALDFIDTLNDEGPYTLTAADFEYREFLAEELRRVKENR